MSTQFVEGQPQHHLQDERSLEIVGAGATVEAVGAVAGVVLAILGLAGALPPLMVAVATIVLGAALLFEGGAIASRYTRLLHATMAPGEGRSVSSELAGGMSAESLAGITGVVLGILALLGLFPQVLAAIAIIAFGAGLMLGSSATSRLNAITVEQRGTSDLARRLIGEAASASGGGQALAGGGAVVLGILALLGFVPTTLTLVALLAIGAAMLLSGSALGAKMLGVIRHPHV